MKQLHTFQDAHKALDSAYPHYDLKDRSELVHEIISRKPSFVEKWALSIFAGILLLMLASLWFVKYPDTIEARAVLTSENAPKEIITKQDGRLVRLFVHNNERVKKNEVIGWLESTANHAQVLKLSKQIDSSLALLQAGALDQSCIVFNEPCIDLGELQTAYHSFNTSLTTFRDYVVTGYFNRRKMMLQNDIESLKKVSEIERRQKLLVEQDLVLAKQSYEMNKRLLEDKILSKEEFRSATSSYVNKQKELPRSEAAILSSETGINAKLKEIQQLDHDILEQQNVFYQAVQSLKSAVDEWQKRYLIAAPCDGKLTLDMSLQENQFLAQGRNLGYVSVAGSRIFMQTNLPQQNLGKIEKGLAVQLRFDAYPYNEAGFVEGTLQDISNLPTDSGFQATIVLKKGLVTNNNKLLLYRNGLRAQAVIITKNMRLLERLYYNLTKSVSVNK